MDIKISDVLAAQLTQAAPRPLGRGAGCSPIQPYFARESSSFPNFCDQPDWMTTSGFFCAIQSSVTRSLTFSQ